MHIFKIFDNVYGGELPKCVNENYDVYVDLRSGRELNKRYKLTEDKVYINFPIKNFCVPDGYDCLIDLFGKIDKYIAKNKKIYIHCRGGVGRTGTIAICYVGYKLKLDFIDSLNIVKQNFSYSEKGISGKQIPETPLQNDYVKGFFVWKLNK